jgi:hypothetical protein
MWHLAPPPAKNPRRSLILLALVFLAGAGSFVVSRVDLGLLAAAPRSGAALIHYGSIRQRDDEHDELARPAAYKKHAPEPCVRYLHQCHTRVLPLHPKPRDFQAIRSTPMDSGPPSAQRHASKEPLELVDQEVLGLADGPLLARIDPPELAPGERQPDIRLVQPGLAVEGKDAPPEQTARWEQDRHQQSSQRICVDHAIAEPKQ